MKRGAICVECGEVIHDLTNDHYDGIVHDIDSTGWNALKGRCACGVELILIPFGAFEDVYFWSKPSEAEP